MRIILFLTCFLAINAQAVPATRDTGSLHDTEISEYEIIPKEYSIEHIRKIIAKAKTTKAHISVKGTQHSQGGHSYSPQGIVLDLSHLNDIKLLSGDLVRIQAGATWQQVIEFLHPLDLSIAIMQSDYDFSVGGTISTNVHGWQANKPPIISTIYGFHILTSEGKVIYCSRDKNYDLFKAAIGGYGLFGVIIDVDLKVVQNKLYGLKQQVFNSSEFPHYFQREVQDNTKASMFFGRFSIHKNYFLKKLIVRVYEDSDLPITNSSLAVLNRGKKFVSLLFASTYNNQFFKKLRWHIETSNWVSKVFKALSRNQLLYHSTKIYGTQDQNTIDLLQEYFIPINRFSEFVSFLQTLEKDISPYLMNLTLRYVQQDLETLLNYAKEDMICFVMYFRGPKLEKFDQALKKAAIKMTDKALELNGSYYLPYRPYQTREHREHFIKAYLKFQKFKAIKNKYDPDMIFYNEFYKNYLEEL
ncbi:FAD-binding oxidoreductase [Candidatus Tisiphia endosymbiont of Beris chalybata]|uniref:FAD-binding oxidoreductase n=1 Tax=Candidatus Tisiphia endosymbiont of Beris chalybata TaxID=3066262 RepID=UPI00312C8DA7